MNSYKESRVPPHQKAIMNLTSAYIKSDDEKTRLKLLDEIKQKIKQIDHGNFRNMISVFLSLIVYQTNPENNDNKTNLKNNLKTFLGRLEKSYPADLLPYSEYVFYIFNHATKFCITSYLDDYDMKNKKWLRDIPWSFLFLLKQIHNSVKHFIESKSIIDDKMHYSAYLLYSSFYYIYQFQIPEVKNVIDKNRYHLFLHNKTPEDFKSKIMDSEFSKTRNLNIHMCLSWLLDLQHHCFYITHDYYAKNSKSISDNTLNALQTFNIDSVTSFINNSDTNAITGYRQVLPGNYLDMNIYEELIIRMLNFFHITSQYISAEVYPDLYEKFKSSGVTFNKIIIAHLEKCLLNLEEDYTFITKIKNIKGKEIDVARENALKSYKMIAALLKMVPENEETQKITSTISLYSIDTNNPDRHEIKKKPEIITPNENKKPVIANSKPALKPDCNNLKADSPIFSPSQELKSPCTPIYRVEAELPEIKVSDDVLKIFKLFHSAGIKEIYLVGGAVRDTLNGVEPLDNDITVKADMSVILKLLSHYKNSEYIDAKHPLFVIHPPAECNMKRIEISMLAGDIMTDANERHITVNQVYYDPINKSYIDPSQWGIHDIKHKIIRFTNKNPIETIRQYPGIIFPVIRLIARSGYTYSKKLEKLLQENTYLLKFQNPNRTHSEITRTIQEKNHELVLKYFDDFRIFHYTYGFDKERSQELLNEMKKLLDIREIKQNTLLFWASIIELRIYYMLHNYIQFRIPVRQLEPIYAEVFNSLDFFGYYDGNGDMYRLIFLKILKQHYDYDAWESELVNNSFFTREDNVRANFLCNLESRPQSYKSATLYGTTYQTGFFAPQNNLPPINNNGADQYNQIAQSSITPWS